MKNKENCGGETGIRTLGTLARSTVFETAPFDHSGTSPWGDAGLVICGWHGRKGDFDLAAILSGPDFAVSRLDGLEF